MVQATVAVKQFEVNNRCGMTIIHSGEYWPFQGDTIPLPFLVRA
jgi:hypothetical protein